LCRNRKCRSVGIINGDNVFSHSEHNQKSEENKVKRLKAVSQIKNTDETTLESNMKIVTGFTCKLEENIY
jgi:hypothetical protein